MSNIYLTRGTKSTIQNSEELKKQVAKSKSRDEVRGGNAARFDIPLPQRKPAPTTYHASK